jgi:hypothetical protein
MSLLGFEVTPAYLTFLALFHFLIYVLMSFPKSLLTISLKVLMFSKSLFKFYVDNISTLHVLNSLSERTPSGSNIRSEGRAPILSFTHVRFSLATFLD